MTPENRRHLRDLLIGQEGYRQFPYTDTTGHVTIGVGRNLTDRGITLDEALSLLDNDISWFSQRLSHHFNWFLELDDNRKMVMVCLCFNLGLYGLLGFKKMLAALEDKDYEKAAEEIVDSKAHGQTGERYEILAQIIRTGNIDGFK